MISDKSANLSGSQFPMLGRLQGLILLILGHPALSVHNNVEHRE